MTRVGRTAAGRIVLCRSAAAEWRSERAGWLMRPWRKGTAQQVPEALDLARRSIADTYNEYSSSWLSAGGAIAGSRCPCTFLMAITGLWGLIPSSPLRGVELGVIFGWPGRRMERGRDWPGRAGGRCHRMMAVAFYYLVAEPTL